MQKKRSEISRIQCHIRALKLHKWIQMVFLCLIMGSSIANINNTADLNGRKFTYPTNETILETPKISGELIDPIFWYSDAEVDAYCADLPGTGIEGDPYIIENKIFNRPPDDNSYRIIDLQDVTR
ncbi:MAG: hypothetical protein ACTSVZ_09355 [Promethearchaeota archaeon]